jgi:DNA-binding LacI/PurR family transcriptional regulator
MKPTLKARGTLRDVAHLVGVSHTTVSNAFSRPDQLSPELREKILAAARSVNYPGPNPAARMLMSGFANTIALVYAVGGRLCAGRQQNLPHSRFVNESSF